MEFQGQTEIGENLLVWSQAGKEKCVEERCLAL